MFPSNSSHNGNDPISYSDQAFCCRPFSLDFESNQTSKQETNRDLPPPPPPPPPSSFFHFPSPFEDNEIFLEQQHDHFLLQFHHQPIADPEPVVNMEVSINNKIPGKGGNHLATEHIPRKRTGKRDRHSKINTARGLRDRRMRLSLEVAKRFFGLQDMLGFEKASKTVEWLLNQAKVEINQLAREKNHHPSCRSVGAKSSSSTSECEGVSSLDEVAVSGTGNQEGVEEPPAMKRRIKHSRKMTFHPLARECREKARERARERTKEKMWSRRLAGGSKQCREAINHNLIQLGSWNPFETAEESGTQSQSVNPSLDVLTEAEEPSSHTKEDHLGTVEDMAHVDSLTIMSKWSPSMIFNSLNNTGLLQENFSPWENLGRPTTITSNTCSSSLASIILI